MRSDFASKDLYVLVQIWVPSTFQKQVRDQHRFFEMGLSDAALFHVIICSSSLFLDFASGSSESSRSIAHKTEAIRSINAHLQDASRISDAIIAAVGFLAKIEVC